MPRQWLQRHMKRIAFLSFGHWQDSPYSPVRTGGDALRQSIELAQTAEEIGVDGAFFRVHHFARQLGSPFPLLAAIGATTTRIEIGTGVIDMRYENPRHMAEDAAAADLIAAGRLQLGVSRGSPEQVVDGFRHFGHVPEPDDPDGARMAREATARFLTAIDGERFAEPSPHPMFPNPGGLLGVEPQAPGLRRRIWWGAGSRRTAEWTAAQGMNLMSSTLLTEDTGVPLHVLQAEQIRRFRAAWREAGWAWEPRVSVSRSIMPITTDLDRRLWANRNDSQDTVGFIDDHTVARFGRSYADEPDRLVEQLADDEAIAEADTLMLTVPSTLGVEYNVHLLRGVLEDVAPGVGWR